jgi:hypothetical protein
MTSFDLRSCRVAAAAAFGLILAAIPPASILAVTTTPAIDSPCAVVDAPCDLHETVVQQVVGSGMTIDGFDNTTTSSLGAVRSITITNARGTGAGWDLTGYFVGADQLALVPSAQVIHPRISGDVAHVVPGPTVFVQGPDGPGAFGDGNLLCYAPAEQSGGTFRCDVSVLLEAPTGAAELTGSLVLTLV